MKHFATSAALSCGSVKRFYEQEERETKILDDFYFNCFDYLRACEIQGDYVEFGCGCLVRSFRLAAKYKEVLYATPKLFAFDSFKGLPEILAHDMHPGWRQGSMAVSYEEFCEIMEIQGVPAASYTAVPGFFQETLLQPIDHYGIEKVSFAFIDCDLYESTKCVLPFIASKLTPGAILAFDDWNCYKRDSAKGQRRALFEFLDTHPGMRVEPFLSFGWHGQSFTVGYE